MGAVLDSQGVTHVKYIKGETPAPHPATDDLLTSALALAAEGVKLFPAHRVVEGLCTCSEPETCKSPGKHPRNKNGSKDATTDPAEIRLWWQKWGKHGRLNIGQTLAGRAVVDIDVAGGKPGLETWEGLCADLAPSGWVHDTLTYRTGRGGTQLVFSLPEGEQGGKADGYTNALGDAVDFKTGPNAYVMVPGSKTESVYTVVMDEGTRVLPEWIATLAKAKATKTATIDGKVHTITGGSLLSELIMMAPDDPKRGNSWLAALAGHYAKQYRDKKDLYLAHCTVMNMMSTDPIEQADFTKTTESIWNTEQAKQILASGGEHGGWLISDGDHLLVEMRPKPDADGPEPPDSFANFDIKAVGLISTPGKHGRSYDVVITRQSDGEQFPEVLDADTLVDFRKLTGWLAGVAGVSFAQPTRAMGDMQPTIRLMRYLESHKAPRSELVGQIGFQPDHHVFLTPVGRIEAGVNGMQPFAGVRPRPDLPGFDRYDPPFKYGFAEGGFSEVRDVIREVLTFHDETALTVLFSWALMSLLKSEIRLKGNAAVFPIFTIEAISGSGKTSGAIKMIGELIGYDLGDIQPTAADLRDKLAAFRSGFVHFDDPDDLDKFRELLRLIPMESTKTKRQDAEHSMSAKLTGGLLITGEGLGLTNQKALMDRTVSVALPSTKGQKSYDHVKELWQRYSGSLTAVAGTLVAEVLRLTDEIPGLVKALKPTTGRVGDSYGIVRAGSRVLDWLLAESDADRAEALSGKGHAAAVTDAWAVASIAALPADTDDLLTLQILPWAVRTFSDPDEFGEMAKYKGQRFPLYPAKIRNDAEDDARTKTPYPAGPVIYFNAATLAEAWTAKEGKGDETRLASAEAITRQAKALGAATRPSPIGLSGGKKGRYWIISGDLAQQVIDRSMG
jgi:hypothetical protein